VTPRPSAVFYPLAIATCIALSALLWSAWGAFALVGDPLHAALLAGAIEISAAIEAVALARARGWRSYVAPIIGVLLSVVVSAVYNYANVEAAGRANGVTNPVYITALALGPLVAMVFLAINTGTVWREYEDALEAHNKEQSQAAKSADDRAAREASNAAYDDRKAKERADQRAHELALAQLQAAQAAAIPQFALGGGDSTPETVAQSTAQRVAQWRADNPQGNKAQCANALGVHPATVGRNWK